MVKPAGLHIFFLVGSLACGTVQQASAQDADDVPPHTATARALSGFLSRVQHPSSGLLESFPRSAEPRLKDVAFTYDVAVSALVLAHRGRLEAAEHALRFYRDMPLPADGSLPFNTAYHVEQQRPTLEYHLHGGPLCWMAISLLRYGERTGETADVEKGIELLEWVKDHLPHIYGGVVMGTQEPWEYLMSVENNWVYYAALRIAMCHLPSGPRREALVREKRGVRTWLSHHERSRGDGDAVKALDVYTHALLVGPGAYLEDTTMDPISLGVWAKNWIAELDELFRVPGLWRYDYTDAQEARLVGRSRSGWLEGTEQVVVAYLTWVPFFQQLGDEAFARELRDRAARSHAEVLQCAVPYHGALAIPNTDANRPFQTFMEGWIVRPRSEPALNGTNWAYLGEVGYNPFTRPLQDSP